MSFSRREFAALASCALIAIWPHGICLAQMPATGDVIEITGTDLFARDHWLSTQVSVDGLMLAMIHPKRPIISTFTSAAA